MLKTTDANGRGRRAAGGLLTAAVLVCSLAPAADAGDKGALFSFKKRGCTTDGCDVPCVTGSCEAPVYAAPVYAAPAYPEAVYSAPPAMPVVTPGCDAGACITGGDSGGRWSRACGKDCAQGMKWHSEEWYEARAHLPPGERQYMHKGKPWLAEPRPCDIEEQPFWHKYHANKIWPYPYQCEDRSAVRTTLMATADRGWLNLTTLQAWHFDAETHTLNETGRKQLLYILNSVPREHRTAYVSAFDRPTAEARMASVQASVVDMAGPAEQIAVMPRAVAATGRPAVEVDRINRAALENMPPPVLAGSGGGLSTGQ